MSKEKNPPEKAHKSTGMGKKAGEQVGEQAGKAAGKAAGTAYAGPVGGMIGEKLGGMVGKKLGGEAGDKAEKKLATQASSKGDDAGSSDDLKMSAAPDTELGGDSAMKACMKIFERLLSGDKPESSPAEDEALTKSIGMDIG